MKSYTIDARRKIEVLEREEEAVEYAAEQLFSLAEEAIEKRGRFVVALSGGSTPKAIYKRLSSEKNLKRLDWSRVLLFWSDERAVSPEDKESNYHMAMEEGGLKKLPIPKENIFRMKAESDIEENARLYEKLIREKLPEELFDLVMLGMGEDGHTASLFPKSAALWVVGRLAVANYVEEKKVFRMTLTFEAINRSRRAVLYVLGQGKNGILKRVLSDNYEPDLLPSMRVGTPERPALFIADSAAAKGVIEALR